MFKRKLSEWKKLKKLSDRKNFQKKVSYTKQNSDDLNCLIQTIFK